MLDLSDIVWDQFSGPPVLPYSEEASAVLDSAAALGGEHIGTDHLLIAFVRGRPLADRDVAAADELIAVPRATLPAEIRELDERIAELRRLKEGAVDAGDFEEAAAVRDREKSLVRLRETTARDWASQVDVLALVEEVEALRAEVDRLHAQGG